MLIDYKLGQTSIVLRVKLRDSSVSTGAGKTGLSSSSSGLIISTIADNEATAVAYTQAGSTIESITTLGTFAAPTATKCRFKEVDATNHKGIYEIQIADARFAVASAKSMIISISGVTNLAECDVTIPLRSVDPYDGVRAGLTALPNVNSGSAGAIVTAGTGTAQLNVTGGRGDANILYWNGAPVVAPNVTGVPVVDVVDWRGSTPSVLISGRVDANAQATAASLTFTQIGNITGNLSGSVGSVTLLSASAITSASFASDSITSTGLAASAANEIRDAVWAQAMTELGAPPAVTDSVLAALEWLFILARNKRNTTSTTDVLRNNADGATIGTAALSDDGSTFVRGKYT